MSKILFINSSPNKDGKTAQIAAALLRGKEYETLDLTEYKIYGYGQDFPDSQLAEVIARLREADTVVIGSPVYWNNLSGLLRCFLDNGISRIEEGEFSGRDMFAVVQGGGPEKWMLDACEFTLKRFAGFCGFRYRGMAGSISEAEELREKE